MKRNVVSPKAVVIGNVLMRPSLLSVVTTSFTGVPPRPSSSSNARSASSTSSTMLPMPSGCFCRYRYARPPTPTGAEQITRQPPPSARRQKNPGPPPRLEHGRALVPALDELDTALADLGEVELLRVKAAAA